MASCDAGCRKKRRELEKKAQLAAEERGTCDVKGGSGSDGNSDDYSSFACHGHNNGPPPVPASASDAAAAKLHDGHNFGRNELALAHADEPMESVSESENKTFRLCCRS